MDIEKLKRAAEAATPGPWEVAVWTCGVRGCEVKRGIDRIGCDLHFPNAAYIAAANPATILTLIARLEAAAAELERLRSQEPVVVMSMAEWDAMKKGEDACCSKFDREMDCSGTIPVLLYAEPKPPTHPGATHCDNCGCTWLDDGLNPLGCPYCKGESK